MKKTVLITGASMGIGLEFARVFAQHGFSLYLVARSAAKLENISSLLAKEFNVRVDFLALNLIQKGAVEEVLSDVKKKGIEIEILVNNAGFGEYGMFKETDLEKEMEMINLNISVLVHLSKIFVREMVEKKSGKILNVASTASFQPGPTMAVYYATKAFVLSFSEAISNELEGSGITVCCLCPGPTQSNFQAAANLEESRLVKGRKLPSAREVAEYGYNSLMANRVVAIHGWVNALMAFSVRFAPRFLVRKIVRFIQDKA